MVTVYEMNYALQRSCLIENRAAVINDSLNAGWDVYAPASVRYPRGCGYGEFVLCDTPMFRWRRYDIDTVERVLENVDAIKRALFVMSASGHMYWF